MRCPLRPTCFFLHLFPRALCTSRAVSPPRSGLHQARGLDLNWVEPALLEINRLHRGHGDCWCPFCIPDFFCITTTAAGYNVEARAGTSIRSWLLEGSHFCRDHLRVSAWNRRPPLCLSKQQVALCKNRLEKCTRVG